MQQHGFHLPFILKQFILFVAAMGAVADNGVKYVGEMLAQLVHAPGLRRSLYQRIPGCGMLAQGYIQLGAF